MATIYGYARCSTDETRQDIDRQKRELLSFGVPDERHIYWEYESGIKEDRVALASLLSDVKDGDTIACTEVSRLSRSTKQLCDILELVQKRKLRLLIGSFSVDCREDEVEPMTKGMLMMWAVFAEMEHDIIRQRVKSGMANAAAKGKRIGRPKRDIDTLPEKFWRNYHLYRAGELSLSAFARVLNCSRTTAYKYIGIAEGSSSRRKSETI